MEGSVETPRWYSTVYPPPDRLEHWTFAEYSNCTRSKLPSIEELGYTRAEFDKIPLEEGVFKAAAQGASAGAIKRAAWAASPVDLNKRPDISLAFAIIAEDKAMRRADDYKHVTGYVERDTSVFKGILYDVPEGKFGLDGPATGSSSHACAEGSEQASLDSKHDVYGSSKNLSLFQAPATPTMATGSAASDSSLQMAASSSGSSSGEQYAAATNLRVSRRRRAITDDASPVLPTLAELEVAPADAQGVELALEEGSAPVSRLNSNSGAVESIITRAPVTSSSSSSSSSGDISRSSSRPRQRVVPGAITEHATSDTLLSAAPTPRVSAPAGQHASIAAVPQGGAAQLLLAGQAWWRALSRKVRGLLAAALQQGAAALGRPRGAAKKVVVGLVARAQACLGLGVAPKGCAAAGGAAGLSHRCC